MMQYFSFLFLIIIAAVVIPLSSKLEEISKQLSIAISELEKLKENLSLLDNDKS